MKCPTCKGKGVIELFTSVQACEDCGGTGEQRAVGSFTISVNGKSVGGVIQNPIVSQGIDSFVDVKLGEPHPPSDFGKQLRKLLKAGMEVQCSTENPYCYDVDMPDQYRVQPTGPYPPRQTVLKSEDDFINYFQQFNGFRWSEAESDPRYGCFKMCGIAHSDYLYHHLSIYSFGDWRPINEAIQKVINAKTQ